MITIRIELGEQKIRGKQSVRTAPPYKEIKMKKQEKRTYNYSEELKK